MKTILRFQSQLLNRRSYKPGRRVAVKFSPGRTQKVPLVSPRVPPFAPESAPFSDAFTQ